MQKEQEASGFIPKKVKEIFGYTLAVASIFTCTTEGKRFIDETFDEKHARVIFTRDAAENILLFGGSFTGIVAGGIVIDQNEKKKQ